MNFFLELIFHTPLPKIHSQLNVEDTLAYIIQSTLLNRAFSLKQLNRFIFLRYFSQGIYQDNNKNLRL